MTRFPTFQDKMQSAGGVTTGFDYLRIGLSVAVLGWHANSPTARSLELDEALWSGSFRFLPAAIIPMFFALSGFLVAGSLGRTRLHQFVTLRVIRLIPALAVEITLSAMIIGLIFTTLPASQYFSSGEFYAYFLNIVGDIHFYLPGVFVEQPSQGLVNGQLWTVPFELECYLALVLLAIARAARRRFAFVAVVAVISLALTVRVLLGHPISSVTHAPGRALVFCFLAGVGLHLCRDVVPHSGLLAVVSVIAAAAFLQVANLSYLCAFPVAYLTAYLGLLRPPAIPFGDLSYGVYLFHWPIQQSIVHAIPSIDSSWLMLLISLPLTAVCAWLSWTLVEKPILVRKKPILAAVDRAWAAIPASGRLLGQRRPIKAQVSAGAAGQVD